MRNAGTGLPLRLLLAGLLALAGIASACTPAPSPATATPAAPTSLPPTATPRPTATPTAFAPAPTPGAGPFPAGWTIIREGDFQLAVPADWRTQAWTAAVAAREYAAFAASDPTLAKALGGADALSEVVLWAFAPQSESGFVDNLNVRRVALGAADVTDMAAFIRPILAQYEELGFAVTEFDASRLLGGSPAASVSYTYGADRPDDEAELIYGRQYFVAAEAAVWILTFTMETGNSATRTPLFEAIADTLTLD